MRLLVPVMELFIVSVPVMVWTPGVLMVAPKLPTPLDKGAFAGKVALAAVLGLGVQQTKEAQENLEQLATDKKYTFAQRQAAALRQALTWLAAHPDTDNPTDDHTDTSNQHQPRKGNKET